MGRPLLSLQRETSDARFRSPDLGEVAPRESAERALLQVLYDHCDGGSGRDAVLLLQAFRRRSYAVPLRIHKGLHWVGHDVCPLPQGLHYTRLQNVLQEALVILR